MGSSAARGTPAHRHRAAAALVGAAALTVALYVVPYGEHLAYPLVLFYTLAHELGHGIAAVLTGGRFESLALWPDASGVARYAGGGGRIARAVVSFGGLVGPAVLGAAFFVAARRADGSRAMLWALAAGLVAALVLVVDGATGWLFAGALAVLLGLAAARGGAGLVQFLAAFLGLQLCLGVFSRGDYLFTDVARTGAGVMPSDVAQIAEALWLPYWFWGAVAGGVSVLIVLLGIRAFLRAQRGG